MKNKSGIPILYYHSIADHERKNEWSFLSISINLFKRQMDYLFRKGYYACDWKELDDHINGIKKLPEKTVMLHFDDGFLDNWSVVFPIMKEKNFKYSIVVTPEFIQNENEPRPFVKETKIRNQKDWWGYLNKREIRIMSDSGLVDFQAHGYTHTWYDCSDELVDIYDGKNFYPHLGWNREPDKKPYWLTKPIEVPIGYPIFEHKKSLELSKKFIINEELKSELLNAYDKNRTNEENLDIYKSIIENYREKKQLGVFETPGEANVRLIHELKDARIYIENITGKPVEYLVFPGGGTSETTIAMCKKAGYKLISKGSSLNLFGSKIYQVNRYSAAYSFPSIINESLNVLFLQLQLKRAKGNFIVTKLFNLLRA